jgi:dTDP-4-dehydrorhamnose 3,5-epimerase
VRRIATAIPEVALLETERRHDERGFLAELHAASALRAAGIDATFVQANLSHSPAAWTVRGLHFQAPPAAQAKLTRVLTGAAVAVAVDLRCGSPSYGRHVLAELSEAYWRALYVPEGFAHGLLTTAPDTRVLWMLSAEFVPALAGGLAWDDPALGIAWPTPAAAPLVSAKDRTLPRLAGLASPFASAPGVALPAGGGA